MAKIECNTPPDDGYYADIGQGALVERAFSVLGDIPHV